MSLQTNIFENGRWVTRSLDPYHVRAQNTRREEEKTPSLSAIPAKAPTLGLLTRTLVRSSVTTSIIPARIRHKTKNDVLYIGPNHVTIKEASGNYTLKTIAVKDDFDSHIRAARILGDPRECDEGDKYNTVKRDPGTFELKRGTLSGEIYGEWPLTAGEEQHAEHAAPPPKELPPHILALALESDKLVFVYSVNGPSNKPHLLSSQHPLPVARSPNQRLGRFIAVDPKSRAMAVAAHEGLICVYAFNSMSHMRKELREGPCLSPIKEERLIPVEGSILMMEFLHPPQNDPDQVLLLLIVSRKERSGKNKFREERAMMIWYEWTSTSTLRESQFQESKHVLQWKEQMPLLLIPLVNFTSFMLVCEEAITVYLDILAGTPTPYVQHLEAERDPEEPGTSRKPPLWVQWARPMRSDGHRFTHVKDAIYLCREDGIVQYLEFHNNVDRMFNSTHQAGRLGIAAGTSFAILDVGPNTVDLIVVGGEASEGGLWRVEPRIDRPVLVDAIANWTHLNDFTVVYEPSDTQYLWDASKASSSQGQQRMFACTGKNRHGAVSELRYGVQAFKLIQARELTNMQDEIRNGILGIWAFHGFFGDSEYQFQRQEESLKDVTYVLISHPTRTSLLFMPSMQNPDLVEDAGLDLFTRTIFAGTTAAGRLVQVTESSIILSSISEPLPVVVKREGVVGIDDDDDDDDDDDETQGKPKDKIYMYKGVHSTHAFRTPDPLSRITAACIYNDVKKSTLLVATEREGQFYLQLAHLDIRYSPHGEPWLLDSQSSSLHLHKAGDTLLALVATLDSKLQVFVQGKKGLDPSTANPYTFTGDFAICDSIAIITSVKDVGVSPQYLIVCGLRNGAIQTLRFTQEGSKFCLSLCEQLVIGSTSVTIIADITRKSRVICHCERLLCTIEYPMIFPNMAPSRVRKIWVTDPSQPAFAQGTYYAITQAVHSWLPKEVPGLAFGALVGIDGDCLQVLQLDTDYDAQLVPHRLTIGGTPMRILYSYYLNKLVVLYGKFKILRASKKNELRKVPGGRARQHSIAFLDPNAPVDNSPDLGIGDVKQEQQANEDDEILVAEPNPTEIFLGITEWFPKVHDHQWHFLIINTMAEEKSKKVGRLLFFNIINGANGKPKLKFKHKTSCKAPVYSVAVYPDRRSIVYCSGSELFLQSLDSAPSGLNLHAPIKVEMRSPAQYLTIKAPYIYVSSNGESLAVYKYEDGKLVYQYGDQSARVGWHHVHVPEHSLILASDKANTVVGLWQPDGRRIDNSMTSVFEAILPSSITCLRRVPRPIWYRDPTQPQDDQSIIGSSLDGTITQLDVLSKGWRLLRFIQNMAERNEVVCPFKGRGPFNRHIEPSTSRPHHMHINGNILQRVMERGGEQLIKEMLDVEPDLDEHTDFDTADGRWDRFKELAEEIVDTEDESWLAALVQWVRYRLRSAL